MPLPVLILRFVAGLSRDVPFKVEKGLLGNVGRLIFISGKQFHVLERVRMPALPHGTRYQVVKGVGLPSFWAHARHLVLLYSLPPGLHEVQDLYLQINTFKKR